MPIIDNNWALVHATTKRPVREGEKLPLLPRRGEVVTVNGGRAPQKPGSTGRVWTERGEFFPSVLGLLWIQGE